MVLLLHVGSFPGGRINNSQELRKIDIGYEGSTVNKPEELAGWPWAPHLYF